MSTIAVFAALGGGAYAQSKIGTNEIRNGAVTTQKLNDRAVTTKKIGRQAVKPGKIANGAVRPGKLSELYLRVEAGGSFTISGFQGTVGPQACTERVLSEAVDYQARDIVVVTPRGTGLADSPPDGVIFSGIRAAGSHPGVRICNVTNATVNLGNVPLSWELLRR